MSRSGCWWFPMSLINSQEKQPALLDQVHDLHIAMEPGLGGQEKRYNVQAIGVDPWSQWSLAVAARKSWCCRNCIPGWGGSQWSLAVAARKSRGPSRGRPRRRCRNGAWPWRPGKETSKGSARRTSQRRNGAWPWRPGKASPRTCRGTSITRRNGAWPWRPGKAGWAHPPQPHPEPVAMEPGRGGQEKPRGSS